MCTTQHVMFVNFTHEMTSMLDIWGQDMVA